MVWHTRAACTGQHVVKVSLLHAPNLLVLLLSSILGMLEVCSCWLSTLLAHKAVIFGYCCGCMVGMWPGQAQPAGSLYSGAWCAAKRVVLTHITSTQGETCRVPILCSRHGLPEEQHPHATRESELTAPPVQGPSYAGLIAHRVWGCHPTRHRWAGFTLAGAVAW